MPPRTVNTFITSDLYERCYGKWKKFTKGIIKVLERGHMSERAVCMLFKFQNIPHSFVQQTFIFHLLCFVCVDVCWCACAVMSAPTLSVLLFYFCERAMEELVEI